MMNNTEKKDMREVILPPKPEILSPAGNFEKLKSAFLFGADAVYFAGKSFGMRAAADNFTLEEIENACAYAHSINKKLYLTVNTVPNDTELPELKRYFSDIKALDEKPDAFICADIGVVMLVREMFPDIDAHISTQANTQNHLACLAWAKLGAKRIILSRELSLEDIRLIRENLPESIEIECFVHGSMCVSYSGRCLLSNYLVSRDANRGMCTQPCRWKYYVIEEKRPDTPIEIVEDTTGTFLFSSKDLCMIDHVDELVLSGINSFKIEGRMKSAYYTASVTNAYRIALDRFYESPSEYSPDSALRTEVESVSHREYDTGYFFDKPHLDAKICGTNEYIREKAYLGICVGYDEEIGCAVFEQRNKAVLHQKAQILSPSHTGIDLTIDYMFDAANNPIESAPHPFMVFKIKTDIHAKKGDILRGAGE